MSEPVPIRVIIAKTDDDMELLKQLDREGQLASGSSYPSKEDLLMADHILPRRRRGEEREGLKTPTRRRASAKAKRR